MATKEEIEALFAQFNAPKMQTFGQPQTLSGLGYEEPSWMSQPMPDMQQPKVSAPEMAKVQLAAPAVDPVPIVPSFGEPIQTSGENPLKAALAEIGTSDLIDAEETGRQAARVDVAEGLMANNPYRERVPSLVQETPQIDFDALLTQLSKAGG